MKILMFNCADKTAAETVAFCKNIKGFEAEHGLLAICGTFSEDCDIEVKPTFKDHCMTKRGSKDYNKNRRKPIDTVVNKHNICLIHRESEPPHTAVACNNIKAKHKEYVAKRKKWSSLVEEWHKKDPDNWRKELKKLPQPKTIAKSNKKTTS